VFIFRRAWIDQKHDGRCHERWLIRPSLALEERCSYTDNVAQRWGDSVAAQELGISTYASKAVRTNDGVLYGTLCAASDESRPMADGAEQMLQMFSTLIAERVERERLVLALVKANEVPSVNAMTDATTQLPNRRALMREMDKRLSLTVRGDPALIVAFIDLDKFKAVNDLYGHDTGDQLLVAIGARIQGVIRLGDFVARLGGDEFVVLATASISAAEATAEVLKTKLQAACSGKFQFDDQVIDYEGPSTGVIVAQKDAHDSAKPLAQADAAMYESKRLRSQLKHAH
jgi:diguanylate cyclase